MTGHPAVAARSFAAGLFSQKGERIQVNDVHQQQQQSEQGPDDTNDSEQKHHRHGPPLRIPSFGSHSSGVSDSFSSVSNRFNALRRAPSFSFILNFDTNTNTNNHSTAGSHTAKKVETVEGEAKKGSQKIMNKFNRDRSIKGRLNGVRNVIHKYNIVFFLILSIIIARAYPPLGGTYLVPHITSSWIAVMIIFTLVGMGIKTEVFFGEASQRLEFNMFVQGFSFLFVSAIVYGLSRFFVAANVLVHSVANGMVICSCLPATLNMVMVLTRISGGNESAAIFNCTLGTIVGTIIGPSLITVYLGASSNMDALDVFYRVVLRVILPMTFGQFLQKQSKRTMRFFRRFRALIMIGQRFLLTFVVYTIFCLNFLRNMENHGTYRFSSRELVSIPVMIFVQFLLQCLFMVISWHALDIVYTNEPKLRCMGIFGCTHKNLAIGVPLINVIYESDPKIGLLVLPLLVWHTVQLCLGSWIAPYLRVWSTREQLRLEIQSTEDDDEDDEIVFSDDVDIDKLVVDEESLVSSVNDSHISFATSGYGTSQTSEVVRVPATSKKFNAESAAVEAAKAKQAYARIIESKQTTTTLEDDIEIAIAEPLETTHSSKKTMTPHEDNEIMVNRGGNAVEVQDKSSTTATTESGHSREHAPGKDKRRSHKCPSDHRCYEEGVVYDAITKPVDLVVMQASYKKLHNCADCGIKIASRVSEMDVHPKHGAPVYVCRECLNHLVCNNCWRRSKVPGWANHFFDMYM